MRNLRTLIITSPTGSSIAGTVTYHLFNGLTSAGDDPDSQTDSEALHDALCRIDPGDRYTVEFRPSE